MKYTHLILHGSYGTPDENWFKWLKHELETQGKAVVAPQFPVDSWNQAESAGSELFTPKHQTLKKWLSVFAELLPQLDQENLTVVAHSSAPLFILHVLQRYPNITLKQVLFVAPFLGKIGDVWQIEKVNQSFYAPNNFDFEKVKQQISNATIFYSDNDPYVPVSESLSFASKIDADIVEVKNAGHFNTDAGYTDFPLLLEYL